MSCQLEVSQALSTRASSSSSIQTQSSSACTEARVNRPHFFYTRDALLALRPSMVLTPGVSEESGRGAQLSLFQPKQVNEQQIKRAFVGSRKYAIAGVPETSYMVEIESR